MKKLLFLTIALATTLVACQKNEAVKAAGERTPVQFSVANLGTYQFKSSTLTLGETGCSNVGIYAADLGANNVQASVSGSTLTPASPIYWGMGQTTSSTFVARYPYAEGVAVNDAYTIPASQNEADVFTYQNNFMHAVTSASPDPGTVSFDFKHPFAKVVVNITNNLGADAVASVVMKNLKQTATTLNIATAPATITLSDTKSNVTAYCSAANKYELVVMPQAATNEMDIVVTTSQNSVYTFRINLTSEYSFVAGKQSVVAVTLDPIGGGSASGRTAIGAVSFSTPEEWTDGAATTIDTVGDPTLGNYYQIYGCVYSTADKDAKPDYWAKNYPMTYEGNDTWTITINYDETMAGADDTGIGFLVKLGSDLFGMWTGSSYIEDGDDDYALAATNADHGNIKLQHSTGKYTLTYNSSTKVLAPAYLGDAE